MSEDTYGYTKLTPTELRKVIADLVRSNEEVIDNKKEMVTAANETIKETKTRITAAVECLTLAERAGTTAAAEKRADQLLRAAEEKL